MTGYVKEQLDEALKGSEIVLIPAGVPRKPGMTRDGTFVLSHEPVPVLKALP